MTGFERDFDRIARAWLDLGPNEAPDRAVAAALQAVETTPQQRRPFPWPTWRSTTMTRITLLAVLAGTIAIIVGGLVLSGGNNGPAPAPSVAPAPSASSAAAGGPLPPEITGGWTAASRGTELEDPVATTINIGGSSMDDFAPLFSIDRPGFPRFLGSNAVVVGPGVIRFTLSAPGNTDCEMRDAGSYGWSLSPDRRWLTFELIDDACPVRGEILSGTWQRNLGFSSRGGTGIAVNFEPFMTFTLPDGEYAGREFAGVDEVVIDRSDASYKVWKDLDGFLDPCDIDKGRLLIEPGMDALLAYFEDDPRFSVVRREEYELDGHRAVEIEFSVGADMEPPCWMLDGNPDDRSGVLTWVPERAQDGFWNSNIKGRGLLVITEVDGATLAFEFASEQDGLFKVDRETLDSVRFLDALPEPPAS